ncbi:hypothetical protein [Candidatus Desulfovibrio trichonymphae]|uniref:hypothetical protein n=1 Tax=Candidatus Desulfovibrio trichonymphae TaxID=1725232 RepID=UPI0011AB72FF|nr:hypothetical protein [Candidatus Desulfovibrio trichonymphae]
MEFRRTGTPSLTNSVTSFTQRRNHIQAAPRGEKAISYCAPGSSGAGENRGKGNAWCCNILLFRHAALVGFHACAVFLQVFSHLDLFFAAWAELTQDTTVPAAVFDTYAGSAKERKKLKPINNAVFFMAIPLVIIFFT